MNTAIKKAINGITLNKQEIIKASIKIIAKTASKGTIHKKNASNKISKIMNKNFK
jgi:ribosomal protein S20